MVIKQRGREANIVQFPYGRDVTYSSSRFFGSSRLLEEQSVETTDMIPYEYGQRIELLLGFVRNYCITNIVGYSIFYEYSLESPKSNVMYLVH